MSGQDGEAHTSEDWKERVREEHRQLMERIKDEAPRETVDISGMGGSYEWACQQMLEAGFKFLSEHPDFVFDYKGFRNVYGLIWSDSPRAKVLESEFSSVAKGYTGGQHQAVIGHLAYIHKHGRDEWLAQFEADRRYVYPVGLPAP